MKPFTFRLEKILDYRTSLEKRAQIDLYNARNEYIKMIKDRKIIFNKLQQSWINYRELYKLYRKADSKEERKRIRELIMIENNKRLA